MIVTFWKKVTVEALCEAICEAVIVDMPEISQSKGSVYSCSHT